jgi:glycosyltransferase involved in cell wall biosynthesis
MILSLRDQLGIIDLQNVRLIAMVTQQPLISVIIPAYNRRHMIETAIQGVLTQTYHHYELIVIDDASTDCIADWITVHYPQITLIRLDDNVGAAEARNVGIRAAKGELIAFLDSDDFWHETYLETQAKALIDNPKASFVFCNHHETLQDNTIKACVYKSSAKYQDLIHRSLADVFIYTMSVVVARKNALDACNLLNKRLIICHDRELYIRLLQVGEMAHVEASLVTRVMHSQNISTNYRRWAKYVFMTLDIFFSDPKNQAYLSLEPSIRSNWAMVIARHIWRVEKAPLSSILMLVSAAKASPGLMFQKLQQKLLSVAQF